MKKISPKKLSKKHITAVVLISLAILTSSICIFRHLNQNADEEFSEYTHNLFCQEVSGSTITLHYTLKDPSSYGIENVPVTYGRCTTDTRAICAAVENEQARLHSHKRSQLSKENQLTYDVLDDYLSTSLSLAPYSLYEEPLAPLTGTQAQLPILLSEYQFYTSEDVDTYLELLTKTPEYFQSILEFEQAKAEAGLFMASYTVDDIVKECRTFVNLGEKHYLYSSFTERLDELSDLSDDQKETYENKNSEYLKEYVFPAYTELAEGLSALRTAGKNKNGLCYLPEGKKYYEFLVARETGSDRSIQELQTLTSRQIMDDLTAMQETLSNISSEQISSVSSDLFNSQGSLLENNEPSSILADLESQIDGNFPELPPVTTKVKYVQESMEEYLSPAFYMVPAIDNTEQNVIYINQRRMTDDISLFTTLAHEGYPGHLYQNVYYAHQKPDPIRCVLNYSGYTEGWATYSEMLSYYYTPLSQEQATLFQRNTSVILGLYALADMGIHYDGWSLLDTVSFFHTYGITDPTTIEDIYDLIIADPANYLKYYIGYVEFLELKKDAVEKWGENFTQKKFHKAVLDIGPTSFNVIRQYIFLKRDRGF
ncbi:MAG: DUF885 domain-containing protein [Dorea sp.]|nr:DUF885 domain-containing protein [Dorea sp.]